MTAYYNEIDPFAAQWLRELIKVGAIAPGDVDERSIEDVRPDEIKGYTQCHFFAGIGVWSYALRRAGIPDETPIWTGSCPCQPFSSAGKRDGFDDERHLWPAFQWLIQQCAPPVVLGEQVASKSTGPWFDLVQADMEALGYAFGCVPFPSAGVGAPHLRDRAYWVANSSGERWDWGEDTPGAPGRAGPQVGSHAGWLADTNHDGPQQGRERPKTSRQRGPLDADGCVSGLGHTGIQSGERLPGSIPGAKATRSEARGEDGGHNHRHSDAGKIVHPGSDNGFWRDADWLLCRDGKLRPAEPGTFPLVDGLARGMVPSSRQGMAIDANKTAEARVMRLRGYGNAINAVAAELFIRSVLGVLT